LEGDLMSAKATLDSLGANYEVVGNGYSVVAQSPVTGTTIAKGGTVYLYTDPSHTVDYTDVPDLTGVDPALANDIITYSGLNYVATGASVHRNGAVVNSQSIEPGKSVPYGTTIVLEFTVVSSGD
ncbi:MAG: PASTA domain-containing protein, partial [Ruminococcus sp.]|nr:PASTA domain-containing protein [Ruminococcus sp.]